MRDPARIPKVLGALMELWYEFPDYRFGQLVMNLCRPLSEDEYIVGNAWQFVDPWEWEEDEWLRRIEAFRAKHGAGN